MGIKKKNPFILPKRLNPAALENEYDHKRFEQWVSDLPIGDVSSTAHALHTELNRMNHLEMSPIERFAALELVLPSISFVLEKLRIFFVSLPLPLSRKNRLVARLHLELLVRIVIGYKTILAQFHDDSFTGYLLHKRTRVESSRRLLYFLGELLRHACSIYKTCPEFVWKEIYGVYHYTVMHELESKEDDVDLDIIESIVIGEIDISECISVNESSKGCHLTWPGEGEYQVRVGELIGVNPRNSMDLSESWGLGVVRWVRIQSHGLMGFGVELLPGKITPVRLECWRDGGSDADVILGFQQKVSENVFSLITQPLYIGLKDRFLLLTNTECFPVVPGKVRECTDSIMQFDIKVTSGVVGKAESNKKYSASDGPFSVLWNDLDI